MTTSKKGNTVLVVEDDMDIREAVTELLIDEGYEVHGVSNGRDGLAYLRGAVSIPSLILLDLMMPVMDGHQFIREKDADARIQGIPVVVMTADAYFQQNPAQIPTAVALLKKPIDIDQLTQLVQLHS
jgi:two-component system, chemotaxis family, chemotaxis protein CheY